LPGCTSPDDPSPGRDGRAFLWIWAVSGFVFLSLVSIKIVVYLLPLFAPLSILTARTLLGLDERRKRLLFALMAILFLGFALAASLGEIFYPLPLKGLALAVIILLGIGHSLFHFRDLSRQSLLLLLLVGLTVFIQPAGRYIAPSLDPIMSPKSQAMAMRGLIDRGYFPLSYNVYSGTYTYYVGQNILEASEPAELEAALAGHDKVVLAMRKKDWDNWGDRPNLRLVHEQVIVDRPFVLVVKE
jgi:4-amino-4-deoxy-L-arabinose transferase-like glycosyltransferase